MPMPEIIFWNTSWLYISSKIRWQSLKIDYCIVDDHWKANQTALRKKYVALGILFWSCFQIFIMRKGNKCVSKKYGNIHIVYIQVCLLDVMEDDDDELFLQNGWLKKSTGFQLGPLSDSHRCQSPTCHKGAFYANICNSKDTILQSKSIAFKKKFFFPILLVSSCSRLSCSRFV